MKPLHLTLKKEFFTMIKSGVKKEEYREIKPYWISRFCEDHPGCIGGDFMDPHTVMAYTFKEFDYVIAKNGYSGGSPLISWKHEGITIGTGNPEWGAIPGKIYFILKIGELQ